MKQSKLDSFMEAVVNVIIGLIVSTIANHFLLPAVLGVQMSFTQNIVIGSAFTVISIVRSYALRRAFNGRSVWTALKSAFSGSKIRCWLGIHDYRWFAAHNYRWVQCRCGAVPPRL